jgi:hypothetical protein
MLASARVAMLASYRRSVGQVLRGEIPDRALRLVRAWADEHRDELHANWARIQVPEQPQPIDPLP